MAENNLARHSPGAVFRCPRQPGADGGDAEATSGSVVLPPLRKASGLVSSVAPSWFVCARGANQLKRVWVGSEGRVFVVNVYLLAVCIDQTEILRLLWIAHRTPLPTSFAVEFRIDKQRNAGESAVPSKSRVIARDQLPD